MNEQIDDWQEDGAVDPAIAAIVPAAATEPLGTEDPAALDARPAAAADTSTLEDHEAENRERGERDRHGRFKQRAESQKATPREVPLINELTKRIKTAEAAAGADIVRQDGESNRVFELRRRAELAERRIAATEQPEKPAAAAAPVPATIAPAPVARPSMALPPVKAAKDDPEPQAETYGEDLTKWMRDHSRWAAREELRAAHESYQAEEQKHAQQAELHRLSTQWEADKVVAKGKYADFESVAYGPLKVAELPQFQEIPSGSVIDNYILTRPGGNEVLYHLKKNPAEFLRVWNLPSGVDQFEALAIMARQLTGTAEKKEPAPKPAAVVPTKPAAKPPTPIATAPLPPASGVPGDDGSLEDHERAFYRDRRSGRRAGAR